MASDVKKIKMKDGVFVVSVSGSANDAEGMRNQVDATILWAEKQARQEMLAAAEADRDGSSAGPPPAGNGS